MDSREQCTPGRRTHGAARMSLRPLPFRMPIARFTSMAPWRWRSGSTISRLTIEPGSRIDRESRDSTADREIHVNGAVALAQWQYYLPTHDRTWLEDPGFPVIRSVADFWGN